MLVWRSPKYRGGNAHHDPEYGEPEHYLATISGKIVLQRINEQAENEGASLNAYREAERRKTNYPKNSHGRGADNVIVLRCRRNDIIPEVLHWQVLTQ